MLLIAVMVLPAAGNVLCIGPDGHAALEPAHPVDGCDEVGGRAAGTDEHLAEISTPGGCVDLPLAIVEWMPRPEREQEQFDASTLDLLTPIYLIDLSSDADASSTPSRLSRWADQDSVPELLLSLRSTVLLL
jgi:hypothetical protein